MPDEALALKIEVSGLEELQKELTRIASDLHGSPMVESMRDVVLKVLADAMKNAPVHTGRLRASLVPEVTSGRDGVVGIVGSDVSYAPFMEFGTSPHWAPIEPLVRWVELKFGADGQAAWSIARGVQRAIAAKGQEPRLYLGRAVDENMGFIEDRIGKGVDVIITGR